MPLLFLVAGLILIVTVIRGTTGAFAANLRQDVSGGYLKWLAAILIIGALGYAEPLREPSRYLLALVALVILLTNGSGFIAKLQQELSHPGTATPTTQAGGNPNLPAIPVSTSQSGQSNSPSPTSSAASLLPIATTAASIFSGL